MKPTMYELMANLSKYGIVPIPAWVQDMDIAEQQRIIECLEAGNRDDILYEETSFTIPRPKPEQLLLF